jgi:hypothetical protein
LLIRQLSLSDLPSFFVNLLLPSADIIFPSLQLTLVGSTDLGHQSIDVSAALTDLLGQIVDLNPLLELLPQICLLVLKKLPLIL